MSHYPIRYYKETVSNIQKYLENSPSHNPIERTLHDQGWAGFICSLKVDERPFVLFIRVEEGLGLVLLDLYPRLFIREDKLTHITLWCAEETAKRKTGHLRLDRESRRIFAQVESSFRDGAISGETIAYLEQIALSLLLPEYNQIEDMSEE